MEEPIHPHLPVSDPLAAVLSRFFHVNTMRANWVNLIRGFVDDGLHPDWPALFRRQLDDAIGGAISPAQYTALTSLFFPVAIPAWQVAALVAFSFFTSLWTAATGMGGGTAMMGAMGAIMPVNVLVATHALVQLGSNFGRAVLQRAHIIWPIVIRMTLGGVVGAIAGGFFVTRTPGPILMVLIGIVILWMVWGPKIKLTMMERIGLPMAGAFATFCGMFIGSMGPFVNAVLQRRQLDRKSLIATQAATLMLQRVVKIVVFVALGVALRQWLGMIALMIVTGFAGTYVGTYILNTVPEAVFQKVLKGILTLSALIMIVKPFI